MELGIFFSSQRVTAKNQPKGKQLCEENVFAPGQWGGSLSEKFEVDEIEIWSVFVAKNRILIIAFKTNC